MKGNLHNLLEILHQQEMKQKNKIQRLSGFDLQNLLACSRHVNDSYTHQLAGKPKQALTPYDYNNIAQLKRTFKPIYQDLLRESKRRSNS